MNIDFQIVNLTRIWVDTVFTFLTVILSALGYWSSPSSFCRVNSCASVQYFNKFSLEKSDQNGDCLKHSACSACGLDTLCRTSIISSSTVLPLNLFVNLSLAPLYSWPMVQTLGCGLTVGSPRSSSAPPSLGRGRVVPPPLFKTRIAKKYAMLKLIKGNILLQEFFAMLVLNSRGSGNSFVGFRAVSTKTRLESHEQLNIINTGLQT